MNDKFYHSLSKNSKELIDKGYRLFDIENLDILSELEKLFKSHLNEFSINEKELSQIHNHIEIENINNLRLSFFKKINKNNFTKTFLKLGYNAITEVVGTELASNKMVNFSIQMPGDKTSKLAIHADTFTGESEFQINLWIPLTDCFETNSMFIFNPTFSQEIIRNIHNYEDDGIEKLLITHQNEYEFIKIPYGKGLIFTPTCLHGNVLNETSNTRISFNCRYKNLFSPYCENEESEKKLGSFYVPLTPKAATIIGLNNKQGK
jgi:sporadic carbohydrate cluster 2OG-Fe(II) oxygenase